MERAYLLDGRIFRMQRRECFRRDATKVYRKPRLVRQYYFMAKCGNGPEPEELEATKVGRKDREMNGTIPHGAIDWD